MTSNTRPPVNKNVKFLTMLPTAHELTLLDRMPEEWTRAVDIFEKCKGTSLSPSVGYTYIRTLFDKGYILRSGQKYKISSKGSLLLRYMASFRKSFGETNDTQRHI